ncbi:molybdenum ABC transporter ATP-binding protein [Acidovorax sp. JG5]|uniref:molybdenum ABC transporter ATP-binding protein n=1 Tax=Acidovorax sp. JG5 TaxID=2822718 RepID=UPI001B320A5F|nr:molybdenum ABC transporter ATP-binding protein [Acidovorax sp. JG5]MBP3982005.1 molybdenum ABC transporter ATP-binding protein [Acidovorax sp. JG5]
MTDTNRIRLELPRAQFNVDVDLHLPARGITVLFGASGSGKTTILRCVAGLERAACGHVRIGDAVWQDDARGVFVPTWRRPLGYVFQEASLFGHLDVQHNLEYGLRRTEKSADHNTLDEAIELLGISSLLKRRPQELSGGERQRVAIARALATRPRLLLLDEPLASLDLPRRHEIMPWLERLRDQLATPMLYVTHSMDELSRLADEVVVLENGQAVAVGPVGEILARGDLPALAGEEAATVIQGTVVERDPHWHLARVQLKERCIVVRDSGLPSGSRVRLRVLARDVSLTLDEPMRSSIQNHLPGVVDAVMADSHPAQALVRVRCDSQSLISRVTWKSVEELQIKPGLPIWIQVKSVAVIA